MCGLLIVSSEQYLLTRITEGRDIQVVMFVEFG